MTYVVENIISKTVTTKYGPKPAYNVVANGEAFSYGFKAPSFKIGDTVDFKYTEGTYGKTIDVTSLKLISKGDGTTLPTPPVEAAVAPSTRPYGPSPKPFPIPPLHGDRAIIRQNSLTNAVRVFCECTSDKDKHDSSGEMIAASVIAMARMFEAYSAGDLDLAEAMKDAA